MFLSLFICDLTYKKFLFSVSLGVSLILCSIFKIAPQAKALFEFGKNENTNDDHDGDDDDDDEAMYQHPDFILHAKRVVKMLDVAVGMLGPDLEPVTDALLELGRRHKRYGVVVEHYPIVGQALLQTLQMALGDDSWTPTVREGWTAIYAFVSATMIRGATMTVLSAASSVS